MAMSAAFALMNTDGQDTQKRAKDLQQAGYVVDLAWRRRADRPWRRRDVPESRLLPARCSVVPAGRVVPGPDGDA
jgi:hypothetical protein